jgi:hypothetical protein
MDTFDQSTQVQTSGQPPYQSYPPRYPESGRGILILVCGIFSLVCFGPFTGIPAWVMGNTDLRKIKENIISPSEYGYINAGKILGIIGTFLFLISVVLGITVVVGSDLFNAVAVDTNRNAVVSDMNHIGRLALEYYKTPESQGGGGNSYSGFKIPDKISHNENGEYTLIVYDQQLVIIGTGVKRGDDGGAILHQAIISPSGITIFKRN